MSEQRKLSRIVLDKLLHPVGSIAEAEWLYSEFAALEQRVAELQRQLDYFGSCHAATIEYDGSLRSTSKARLDRFVSIGQKMLPYMTTDGEEAKRLRAAIDSARLAPEGKTGG